MSLRHNKRVRRIYQSKLFRPLRGKIFPVKSFFLWNFRNIKNRLKYREAAPNVFDLIYVNPNVIEKKSGRCEHLHKKRFKDLATVKGGDWDKKLLNKQSQWHNSQQEIEEGQAYKAMEKVFNGRAKFSETEFSEKYSGQNDTTLEKEATRWEELYNTIREEGYKEKSRLTDKSKYSRTFVDDIAVDIGRNGELLAVDGKHRLITAKILSLEKIPVRVVTRHKEWQKKRNQAVKNLKALNKDIKQHPDIESLLQ